MRQKGSMDAQRMRDKSPCGLCESISSPSTDVWNRALLESEHFVVIPSLGALVEGWLLIVPKDHFLSTAALPGFLLQEFCTLKQYVCGIVGRHYGPVHLFEHGPADVCHETGCGVDHAHAHIVPLAEDLALAAKQFLPGGVEFRPGTLEDCRIAAIRGLDYLYVEQPRGSTLFAVHERFGSQTFRKAVAVIQGIPDEYDWRSYANLPNVVSTIARLSRPAEVGTGSRLTELLPV